MAKHTYVTGALFDDDDDDSDVEDSSSFRSRIPPSQPKLPGNSYYATLPCGDQQSQLTLQKQLEIEKRTLESALRSKALLCESEDIGIETAQTIVHQGVQLRNTNMKLDEIKTNLKVGQKHINGIKSVFSEFKNYFSAKMEARSSKSDVSPKNRNANLNDDELYDTIDKPSHKKASIKKLKAHSSTKQSFNVQSSPEPVTNSQNVDDILETTKVEMLHHIIKLKELGLDIGHEIKEQNELIDIIQDKVEEADVKIDNQNKQMNKILGK